HATDRQRRSAHQHPVPRGEDEPAAEPRSIHLPDSRRHRRHSGIRGSASPMDLFRNTPVAQPLAARLRAASLDEYVGQEHLLGPGKPLREALEQGTLHSMVFWGPPGVGKTTLARLLAQVSDAHFETLSAVLSGVKEIRQAVEIAQ